MSGECNECGVTGCVERNHCAFRDEIARLTAQCERLAAEVKEWRRSWLMIGLTIRTAVDSSGSLKSLNRARLAVDENNDLGGGA